jgi:epoxide hydrolase 4
VRGYGRSDAPQAVANYRLEVLVEDVAALVESEGRKSCVLVGHDWGGIVAWAVAARRPERVERLVVLNAPHLDVAPSVMLRHPTQLLRSSYIAFFQLPILAEAALAAGDHALMKRLLLISSQRGVFGEEDLARYAAEWARPGRLTGMLNYYRALARHRSPRLGRIEQPTLLLWGERDAALRFELAQASLNQCENGTLERFDRCTHWLHLGEPKRVADRIASFAGGA